MSDKPFYDNGRADKNLKLIVRSIIGIAMLFSFLLMFVIHPHVLGSAIDTKTLWEAVHPFNWLWDSIAMAGFIFFCLYVSGLAGKTVYAFSEPQTENSSGLIHVIAAVSALSMILFFA